MQRELKFTSGQVKTFFRSQVWLAIAQDAENTLEIVRSVLENVNANIEQIRFAQGKLDTLRWVLSLPDLYADTARFDTNQDGDQEDES